LIRAIFAGSC
jgi:hypothetical protein